MESDSTEVFEEKASFWRGIAAGFLAGVAVAAALRYTPFEKFISGMATVEGKLDNQLAAMEETLASRQAAFHASEIAEGAADARNLPSNWTPTTPDFDRRGAGGSAAAMQDGLDHPVGHPEERMDHIDLSQPQLKFRRSFDMGSAG